MPLRTTLLAAALMTDLAAGAAQPAAGASAGAPSAGPATVATVDQDYRQQRKLCQALQVAAVRTECLREAERSRAQALARLAPTVTPSSPAPPASAAPLATPPALSGSAARSG